MEWSGSERRVDRGEKTIIVEGWTAKDEGDRLNLKGSLKLNFSSGRRCNVLWRFRLRVNDSNFMLVPTTFI